MSQANVKLLPEGHLLLVSEAESILDAARRAGLLLPHSCRAGQCGSCRARLLEGKVHYPNGMPPGITAQEALGGQVLLCQARAASQELVIEISSRRTQAVEQVARSVPCHIERMESLAPDVMAVFIRLPQSETLSFVAGQYIDIMLPDGRRRSFSLANPPHDAQLLELHVRRVRGGEFTQTLFESMREKSLLHIEGPLGQFSFQVESARPALLVGGGTGYAPLRSMLRHLLELGDTRPIGLYWGARSRIDLYEEQLLSEWTKTYPNLRFTPVLSDPQPEDQWTGRTGLVHEAVLADPVRLTRHDVYAAGPPAMVGVIREAFLAAGLPPDQLFFDPAHAPMAKALPTSHGS